MANCEVCKSIVTEFQPRVSLGARRTHLACFKTEYEREIRERVAFEAKTEADRIKGEADAKALRERMTREAEQKVKTEIEEAVRAKAHTEKAKADAEKLGIRPCVRCNKPGPHPASHPGHCGPCWNSAAPIGVSKDAGKVPDMNRFGLLELE